MVSNELSRIWVVFAGRRRTLATRQNVRSTVVKSHTNGLNYLPLVLQFRKQMTPNTSTARPATRATLIFGLQEVVAFDVPQMQTKNCKKIQSAWQRVTLGARPTERETTYANTRTIYVVNE